MATTTTTRGDPDGELLRPPRTPVLVDVPRYEFLMVDGVGDPDGPSFQEAVTVLYGLAYPLVIGLKRAGRTDVKVRPLEALWRADDFAAFATATVDRDAWRWTAMLRIPDDAPAALLEAARTRATQKVGGDAVDRARRERFEEGRCAQVMHLGPFADEGVTVAALHAFISAQGLTRRGQHHEIYLSDPRRCEPAKMRTVLRQPVS
jgi:hypothetical protein